MARKADINNLIRDAEHKDQLVAEAEKNLQNAKENSAEAWEKVGRRRKELEQERNNGLAGVDKEIFWEEITPDELRSKWDELLLITEVKEYLESERAKHKSEVAKKAESETAENDNSEQGISDNSTVSSISK